MFWLVAWLVGWLVGLLVGKKEGEVMWMGRRDGGKLVRVRE